jgi:replicative DNA helicase
LTKYYRLVKNLHDAQERQTFLLPAEQDVYEFAQSTDPEADWYKSLYFYTEEHKRLYDKTKSFAGFTGVTTNKILFDLDSENLEDAQKDAQEVVSALIHNGIEPDALAIYFSGGKGFHVEVETDKTFTPPELKALCVSIANELELKTFDPRVYDAQRVIRLGLSKHNKTGLYKYPLTVDQLFEGSTEDYVELSGESLNIMGLSDEAYRKPAIELPEGIYELKDSAVEQVKQLERQLVVGNADFDALDYSEIDFRNKPKWMPAYKYAAQQGYFPPGTRNVVLLSLAATYKAQGFDMETTYGLLKGVTRNQSKITGQERFSNEELYNNIVKQVYAPSWQGGQFSAETNPYLAQIQSRLPAPHNKAETKDSRPYEIYSIDEVYEKFYDFGTNIDANTIKTGIKAIDDNCRITIGTHTGILGSPGSGKSSLALNILAHTSQDGIKSIFFSLDMYHALIYQKQLQRLTGWSDKKIYKMLMDKNPEVLEAHEKMKEDYKNVIYNFDSATTVENIASILDYHEQTSGEKIKLVLIDYAECLQGPFTDAFANMKLIAHQLKDLANSKDVAVITLVQPQKAAGDPAEPLYSMRQIKGPSDWEQGFALVLGISRPGFGPNNVEKDKYMTINALKNRMGRLFSVDCYFDGARSMIYDIDEDGQIEVDEIKEARAKMAKEKRSGW